MWPLLYRHHKEILVQDYLFNMKLNCTIFIISCILLVCQHAKLKLNTNKNVTAPTCKIVPLFTKLDRMLTLFLFQVMCRCTCGHVTFSGGIRNLIVFGDISFKIQCTRLVLIGYKNQWSMSHGPHLHVALRHIFKTKRGRRGQYCSSRNCLPFRIKWVHPGFLIVLVLRDPLFSV
jgi:hypothetical protein